MTSPATLVALLHGPDQPGLVAKGAGLEKSVLAQSVRWHWENRILVSGNKTVVFD